MRVSIETVIHYLKRGKAKEIRRTISLANDAGSKRSQRREAASVDGDASHDLVLNGIAAFGAFGIRQQTSDSAAFTLQVLKS
jgi:hypothetical protein